MNSATRRWPRTGRPTALQQDVFAAVRAAQQAAVESIRPGAAGSVPHDVATTILFEAGFRREIVHLTGHGLGFRYHEPEPMLMPDNPETLKSGHACSVEPGLYGPEFGGVRLEDNIVVTADAARTLTGARKLL